MIVCSYEDRLSSLVSTKLLVLSLKEHCPDLELYLYCPIADSDFRAWLSKYLNVHLVDVPSNSLSGWDIKPFILLDRIKAGFEEVVWLDSDVILTGDFRVVFGELSENTFLATEERPLAPLQGSLARTQRLGLPVGRMLNVSVNSCVIRVTSFHKKLLKAWRDLLFGEEYRVAQLRSWDERDYLLGSDQDILTGILGSAEFADIPLKLLRPGYEIAHCFCGREYTVKHRLRNLLIGLPTFVHAQGPKPWEYPEELFSELSPYCAVALPYLDALDEQISWASPKSRLGRFLNFITSGNPNLRDLPITAIRQTNEVLRLIIQNQIHKIKS